MYTEDPMDTIFINDSESGFVKVLYYEFDDGIDTGSRLFIEQASVPTFIAMLSQCLNVRGQGEIERRCGNDNLRVYESGHEPQLFYNISNQRADGVLNSGFSGLHMTKSDAEELLKRLSDLTAKTSTGSIKEMLERQLLEAAASGDLNAVGNALASGADVNALGQYKQSALSIAAEKGNLYAVAILLAADADIENFDVADKSPLMAAAFAGKLKVVNLLLRHGAVINRDLLNSLKLKVDIFEENAGAGAVSSDEAVAWRKFLDFMTEKWDMQNEMGSP
ncbi:hypothetical protein BH20ACI4_BH20ACI4_23270 [soil metagenome]